MIYVDSGAGQSLCTCSSAFMDLTPCKIEITGVAGSLQIYGCGTALFLVEDVSGQSFLLQVHNCLYGQGQFNLLSVSQFCQNPSNSVDLNLDSPSLRFERKKGEIRLPLFLQHHFNWTILDSLRFGNARQLQMAFFVLVTIRFIGGTLGF